MKYRVFRLDELINFNPARVIKRGTNAPFVEMAAIPEASREIEYHEIKEYEGVGSRFANGDTLFARITPCLENGKAAKVHFLKDGEHGFGSAEFIVLSAKDLEHDADLVYYICRLPIFRDYAKSRMQGLSGRQRVDWRALAEFEIELPENPNDRFDIGFKLKTLDDKIRVNKELNKVVEEIAQTLFKNWFVDFEPVRAKIAAIEKGTDPRLAAMQTISGKSLDELLQLPAGQYKKLAAAADLFPDELVGSEYGQIPKGWELKPLYDTAAYVNGATFKSADFSADRKGFPVVKISELKSGITAQTKFTVKEIDAKYEINSGDILYSWSGSPETSLEVFKWFGGKGWLNQYIFLINTDTEAQQVFVFNLLRHLKPVLIDIAKKKQTTGLGHLTVADMKRLMVPCPDENGLQLIQDYLSPLYAIDSNNIVQIENLKQQRDALIPKLLSGALQLI